MTANGAYGIPLDGQPTDTGDWWNHPATAYAHGLREGSRMGYERAMKELGAIFRQCFAQVGEDADRSWESVVESMTRVDRRRAWDTAARQGEAA